MSAPRDIADQGLEWLTGSALPLWRDHGFDPTTGLFHEALDATSSPVDAPLRVRVQARQTWVFAQAARRGLCADGSELAVSGYRTLETRFRAADDLFVFSIARDGQVADGGVRLYEQAFVLFALAGLYRLDRSHAHVAAQARRTLAALERFRHSAGGFRERGERPFQANAQMHLFEAALAWASLDPAGGWSGLADEIADLALTRLIDAESGFIREVFTEAWAPATGPEGQTLEPGHQFEWAWLLDRHARQVGRAQPEVVGRLWRSGLHGVDPVSGLAINTMGTDFAPLDASARLWPQCEFLKAALMIGDEIESTRAAAAMFRYLEGLPPGLWRDRWLADGGFREEPSPASSLYHLAGAILEMSDHARL